MQVDIRGRRMWALWEDDDSRLARSRWKGLLDDEGAKGIII